LVEDFGPRYHKDSKPYIDNRCTKASFRYPYDNLKMASKYVFKKFIRMGYEPYKEWINPYLDSTSSEYNVVATKIGAVYPNSYIEIVAHLDSHVSTPGASDNAVSVAAMIQIAQVLKDYPNRYSLRYVSFVGEEYGLVGSRRHVRRVVNHSEKIKAALVMDGIGWSEVDPENMNCLWDNGSQETRRISYLFKEVKKTYNIDIRWRLCSPTNQTSDNRAYWERGYTAVLSVGGLPYTDKHYHKCSDTMGTVDMANAYKTGLQNLAVLLRLDAENKPPVIMQPPIPLLPRQPGTSH